MKETEQIKQILEKIDNKDFGFYFFVIDTKGVPTAAIANIYEHVKLLNELGYKASVMHEKNDYKLYGDETTMGISDWLGEEYAKLPHISIESQTLNVGPADYIVIPEIFSTIMDQVKTFPCKKIVFSQAYDYILEMLPVGKMWNIDYGFHDAITTTNKQAQHIKSLFPSVKTHVVPVSIPKYFKRGEKPKQPTVAILTRNQSDTSKIVKSFYLQYPIYKWVSFKELRNLPRQKFAEELDKCCLAVWVDDSSGFGTFPLEAMKTNTPVIGKIPNLVPEWMETTEEGETVIAQNGIWTNSVVKIPELIVGYLKAWFEDAIPQDFLDSCEKTVEVYSEDSQRETLKKVYDDLVSARKAEFEKLLPLVETK